MEVNHPINDPSLVSYHRPEIQKMLPGLELVLDCWNVLDTNGRGSEKAKYMPKEPGEPATAYKLRLNRSTYTPIFRDSIKSYAGLLSRFQLSAPPATLLQSEQNVDLQGSSIYSFCSQCDQLAIRDGGVFVMVDMPPSSGESNFLDELTEGRTPYLVSIERRDVINWSASYERGRETLNHVTVRQLRSRPTPSGYGCVIEPVYLVFKPGSVETFRLERGSNGWRQISEGGPIKISLPVIPIVWYGSTSPRFAQGEIPLAGLAELSIQHYQMRSDLQELLHKCAMPVPVRKGAPVGASGKPDPMVIGANSGIDLPEQGSFAFAEPTGKSIERHQSEIKHVEDLMDRSGLTYLYGASVKTATEASLRSAQISSQVTSLIKNKQSSFTTIIRYWAAYSGEISQITKETGISVSDSLIARPIDPSGVAQIINLYSSKMISKRLAVEELQRGGVIAADVKIEEEMNRIDEEDRRNAVTDAVHSSTRPTVDQVRQESGVQRRPGVAPQQEKPSTVLS